MRSRFAEYDKDENNLPPAMSRIGYDADTETYTFSSADGSIWEGSPGSRYGNLTKVCDPAQKPSSSCHGAKTWASTPSRSALTGDSRRCHADPIVQDSPSSRPRSASRVLMRCMSKVTSSLRPRSESQTSGTTESSSPNTLSPDVEDFLFSHVRGQQNQAGPVENR
jgi:hypothetical protein